MQMILKIDSKTERGKALLQFLKVLEENGDIAVFKEDAPNNFQSEIDYKETELSIPTYNCGGIKNSFNRSGLYGIRL